MLHLAADGFFLFLQRDLTAAGAGVLAAVACGMVGCFLVLRRMSLMGDAISHAVLPGIVAAFLLSDSLNAMPVFIGAAVVGVITSLLTEAIHRLGKVESTAALGVVFTVLFAIGVIWLEQIGGRHLHIDADCVLYGNMQTVFWPTAPTTWSELATLETLFDPVEDGGLPRQIKGLLVVLVVSVVFIVAFFKELRITSFDPGLASAVGINAHLMHYLLMTMVAVVTVASFEAVGSILVVAMLIVPGVTARLLTDRMGAMLLLAALIAAGSAGGGYVAAAQFNLDATGMVGLTLGAALVVIGLLSPKYGWISRGVRRLRLATKVIGEDMLAGLFRVQESPKGGVGMSATQLRALAGGGLDARLALRRLRSKGLLDVADGGGVITLTDVGQEAAAIVVRSHRLWESYLVQELGLRSDHVHDAAMRLEHITDQPMRDDLAHQIEGATTDPHGKSIPGDSPDRK